MGPRLLDQDQPGSSGQTHGNLLSAISVTVPFSSVQQVPVVAIITTGGGLKSMTGLYGSLMGLKKLNLLDCVTYISGLSGTTW